MVTYSAGTQKVRLFENSDKIFLFFFNNQIFAVGSSRLESEVHYMSFFDIVLGNLTNPGTNPSNIFRLSALFQDYLGVKAEPNFFDFRL
jgi:hypothetical protein